ncbi:DUF2790 domain-containing protein [Pseudomonas sp. 21615526]|jgi:hypothetical protein|uniref:DUF2790 domain-containing protein n=1 Tax=unclassified Pseudomonas TaxID=196821 RepID=UPI000B3FFA0D|nr:MULTISPECIES: DUF2790 domain-containing protein [unclassified Pseudomonas]NVZ32418.1 DUF2790 domain-containing protein [Pseudomonas sp. A4002]NVZ36697.1 DUF2790 domain-containing protein [Pseudomonas sp. 21615526]NWB10563.1 DUF2790 domain-containing protein [Pseudomonas sp. D5002]NWB24532.1 DUF2790 domain-containing protein [Pseudomonas sp. D4002]NWB74447.1 DUF2790 domain-containing protein [Pseudomonas sp. G5001]
MNTLKTTVAALALIVSAGAMAEGGGDRTFAQLMQNNEQAMAAYAARKGKPAPEVLVYRYGMKLDIAKVVNVTPPIRSCSAVPSRMTYEDSTGKLNTLHYQVMGICRNNGS